MCIAVERDLRGAGQVELVRLERVDVLAVGREEPGPVHRLLAHEHRRQHRRVPRARQRGRARSGRAPARRARRVADEEAEARAREPARRAPCSKRADLGVLRARPARGSPHAASSTASSSAVTVGRRRVRRVRHLREQRRRAPAPRRRAPPRAARSSSLTCFSSLELLRRRLAVELLLRPRSSSTRARARASARRRAAARRTRSAAPRCARARRGQRPGRCGRRGGRSCPLSLEAPRAPPRRPRPARRRADPVGDGLHAVVRVLDRDAVPRPLDELDVVLAVAERDRLRRA